MILVSSLFLSWNKRKKNGKTEINWLSRNSLCLAEAEILFVYNLKSQELNLDNYYTTKFSVFTSTLVILSGFGTSSGCDGWIKADLGQEKDANNFFDADHLFEPNKVLTNNQMYRREGCSLLMTWLPKRPKYVIT